MPLAVGAGIGPRGALGNLAERLFGGHGGQVPDFVTLDYWPTFNLADACVTVGIVIVIACLLFGRPHAPARGGQPPVAADDLGSGPVVTTEADRS